MPPEPLPWDRKDFLREKKHERSEGLGGSVVRWRDSYHGSREFVRWGSEEMIRRSSGHGKQGGYQLFPEESVHGSTPLRISERMLSEEISFRPSSASRGEGRYVRSNRESKGSFGQKEWRGSSWEPPIGDASVNSSSRQHDMSAQRSVSDLLTYSSSQPHSDIENSSWDHQHDKIRGGVDDSGTGHRNDKDQSLGWKPLKWNRSSSLSSRGSGFSHSSSSRSMGADSDELKPGSLPGRISPIQSPSGDATGAAMESPTPSEETNLRKKQRLGWGQGLAKYEKAKVEGSDETICKNGLVPCATNSKTSQSIISSLPDKSPRITGLSECASPVTTSSVACSSSPDLDDKHHVKASGDENDACNLSASPSHGFRSCLEEFSINLEHLELTSVSNLNSLLSDWLQLEDASSGDSNFVKSTAMNKLLLLKCEFSKAVEKTESEIDLFENELKLLNSESETSGPCSVASDSLQLECASKSHEQLGAAPKVFQKPDALQLVSSNDGLVGTPTVGNDAVEEDQGEVKNDDIDSPGTATSKFVEPVSIGKEAFASDTGKHDRSSADAVVSNVSCSDHRCLLVPVEEEKPASVSGSRDENQPIESSSRTLVSSDPGQPNNAECKLHDLILASNRELASKAFEEFIKLLPPDQPQIDIWRSSSLSCQQNNLFVKEKLATRKRFQRFKEKALALKYRSLQHLWKEDMRLLSIRKSKAKSQKRIEINSRTSHIGYQKHRSSIRSRFTSPGSLTLVPTTEIVDFTSKLLSGSQIMPQRNTLKMPALILDEKERRLSRFITSNGLIEDPCAVEKERVTINPWTPKEKETFLEKLATFGKDFTKIASFLDHKTTADCIEFYYKNHKSESFQKIKNKSDLGKQERSLATNTYLVTSGKKWNREVNAASLDLLGAASIIAANADDDLSRQTNASRSFLGGHQTFWGDEYSYEKSSSVDALGYDRDAVAADTLAGICATVSSEAMSSCVTSSIEPGEGSQEWKLQRKGDRPLTPKVMQVIDDEETCSDESCEDLDPPDWTDAEKSNFVGALRSHGKDFAKISRCVKTKSKDECKLFFSKGKTVLDLDMMHPGSGNEGTPVSDANGGQSDTDDACVLEVESAMCSTPSCSKMDVDLPLSSIDTNCETLEHAVTDQLQIEPDRSEENNRLELCNGDAETALEDTILDDCHALETAMEDSIVDDYPVTVKPDLVLCGEYGSVKGVEGETEATPVLAQSDDTPETDVGVIRESENITSEAETTEPARTDMTGTPSEESPGSQEPTVVLAVSTPVDGTERQALSGICAEGLITESSEQHKVESRYDSSQNVKYGVDDNSSRSSSDCFVRDSSRILPNQASETVVDSSLGLTPKHQSENALELLPSAHELQTISWKQKENCPSTSVNLTLQDSSIPSYEGCLQQATSSSTLNFEEPATKLPQKSSSTDMSQQYLSCHDSLNRVVDPSQILKGFPVQLLSKKDLNGHMEAASNENQSILQNFPMANREPNQFYVEDFRHEKCNGSKLPLSVAELSFLSQDCEQSSYRSRSHSQGSSDTEGHSRRSGDVKLFGQILHPSTMQKPISTTHETDRRGACIPKSSSKLFNVKFATDHAADRGLMTSNLECRSSYGFWDGNRIQTGLSSLPDSAILLAKYPAAFSDCAATSSRGDQQSLPAVIKRNDRNLGSVSVYPTKDVNVNGSLPDYQLYRGYDGEKVQPFSVDLKRHDGFCELQKRNGFDVSSFQPHARGVMGMNVMGAGILLGGNCTGVSDPVAAIKMHYAERYGGQAGSIREDDSWRGDIGR